MPGRDIIVNLKVKAKEAVDGLKGFDRGLDDLGKKTEKTGGLFSRFGDNVGKNMTSKLGAAGDAADALDLGLDDLNGTTAAVGAGLVAFGTFVAGGVKKMKELYDQTRDFNEVAGTSWEEGSRLIAVFDDLRVNADEGASAMGKLTKTVGQSPETLKEYGIEIARAKDGTVDMAGTLANVATAFEKTTDPAKRAKLGNELFGRSWQTMVPVLSQGGSKLRELTAAVDDSQVATAEGAKQQDELFEATDNLNDAVDGLQRTLAKDAIPRLAEFAENATTVVNAVSRVNEVIPIMDVLMASLPVAGQVEKTKEAWAGLGMGFGTVGDKVGPLASEVKNLTTTTDLSRSVLGAAADALRENWHEMNNVELRAKEAAKAYDEFEQNTRDVMQAQEDMRLASLGLINTELGLEQAQIRAGDASWELRERTNALAHDVQQYGANSYEAAVAQEEYRRQVGETKGAVDGAAQAAVTHATKLAESRNETLTAAQQTAVYVDELKRMREGTVDPTLLAWMDAQIERLGLIAAQAQSAKEDLQGYNEALYASQGGETNFTGRNANGVAVVRRASGGPVWPGRTYLVGEHGPEMLRFDGTGPGEVLSVPESQRISASMPSVIRRDADGTVSIGSQTGAQVYAPGQYSFPTLSALAAAGSTLAGGGSSPSGLRTAQPILSGYAPPGVVSATSTPNVVYNITINGYADIKKLVDAIKRFEAGLK